MSEKIRIYYHDETFSESEHLTLLEAMEGQRVFQIRESDAGFTIEECCDNNYAVTITRAQLLSLAAELVALANRTKPYEIPTA